MGVDTRRRQLKLIANRISACRDCEGMNEPGVTASAPGFGSADSPVAIVGQSLCRKCMESGISFTGGSGGYIDDALELAGRKKRDLFITNVVHCHPPDDRPSHQHEIDNCRHFLHASWTSLGRDWSSVWVRMRRRCCRCATPMGTVCRGRSSSRGRTDKARRTCCFRSTPAHCGSRRQRIVPTTPPVSPARSRGASIHGRNCCCVATPWNPPAHGEACLTRCGNGKNGRNRGDTFPT